MLNAMTERYPGFWEYATSAEVWASGVYNIATYDGSSETDPVLAGYTVFVSADTIIGWVEASGTTSKNAVSILTTKLDTINASIESQGTRIGLLSDRVDSLQQILSRRDYKPE